MTTVKPQRIRDPLHNLIEFGTDQFEDVLWRVIQSLPFQRLRRIKQLGFSEIVYPGATHTRFAHSVGVFHTARTLMQIIRRHIREGGSQVKDQQAQIALAAALVHDLGHGMFSHAFEEVGKILDLKMAHHEHVSDLLIRQGPVSEILKEMGSGFADDVAEVIKRGRPGNLYDAVVSSQFDADRLDYMQRDRMMCGVHSSGIDFAWLMANLEVGTVPIGVDEQTAGDVETFILGAKASYAAEAYVLSLFQLYPTIYFHKATRGAEKLFTVLMLRIMMLVREGHLAKTGLVRKHPIIRFASNPESLDNAVALDDTVFWGALQMLTTAADPLISECALRLRDRRLMKCIDIRRELRSGLTPKGRKKSPNCKVLNIRLDRLTESVQARLERRAAKNSDAMPRILIDRIVRDPYKRFQDSKGPLNQIRMRTDQGILDMADCSSVVAALEPFQVFRAYFSEDDAKAKAVVAKVIKDELRRQGDGDSRS